MLNNNGSLNFIFLMLLGLVLLILLIAKWFLINKTKKTDLEIGKGVVIGNEEIQEDYLDIAYTPNGTLAVLADGLGKNESGQISSIVSVKTIKKLFLEEGDKEKLNYFFKKAFNKASHEIIKRVEKDRGGASVVSAVVTDNLLQYALVGDTMIAIFRKGQLFKLSDGHSIDAIAKREYYEGRISKDEALYALKKDNLLYYLGQAEFNEIEICNTPIELKKNDIIILMSRGIYENLKWIQLEEILSQYSKVNDLSEIIIEEVRNNQKTNKNNGSIILIKYVSN